MSEQLEKTLEKIFKGGEKIELPQPFSVSLPTSTDLYTVEGKFLLKSPNAYILSDGQKGIPLSHLNSQQETSLMNLLTEYLNEKTRLEKGEAFQRRDIALEKIHSFIKSHSNETSSRIIAFLPEALKESNNVSIVGVSVTPTNIDEDGVYYKTGDVLRFMEFQFNYEDDGEQKTFHLVNQDKVNQLYNSLLKMAADNKLIPIIIDNDKNDKIKTATFPEKLSDGLIESLQHHPAVLEVSRDYGVVMAKENNEDKVGFMSEIEYALRYASLSIMEEKDREQRQSSGIRR